MRNSVLLFISRIVLFGFCLFAAKTLSAATFIVTTTADEFDTPSGTNLSLREALRDANANPGADTIMFSPSLNGAIIMLTNILVNDPADTAGVTIDASALSAGISISCNGISRVFNNAGILTLRALTLTGGFQPICCGGAAIYNYGSALTMDRCTVTGNNAGYGAVFTENNSTTTLRQCTLSGNTATAHAGAIYNRGTTILIHCTVSGNTSQGDAGGIYSEGGWFLSLQNSIVSGNTATNAPEIYNFGTLTNLGLNIVQAGVNGSGTITGSGTSTNTNPRLGTLANNGGPTQTMIPQTGSPAIDSAVGSVETIDQRGFSRPVDGDGNGTAVNDIGAVEFPSSDATLANLTLSSGTLTPSFNSAVTNYTATVGIGTNSITVTPVSSQTTATIKVNGTNVISGSASGSISLAVGTNTITVVVTAQNGITMETNTLTVYRNYVVTTTADSGAGSLRQALIDAKASSNVDIITFAPSLSGQTITFSSGGLDVTDTNGVTIDASALPAGITISGNNIPGSTIVNNTQAKLTLRAVTLSQGHSNSGGGAILNDGQLTLERCTLTLNTANSSYGGAIYNDSSGSLTLRQCTLSGNVSSSFGGALYNNGIASISHCTIAGNGGSVGGGVYNGSFGSVTIDNSIVAGNGSYDVANIHTLTQIDANIIQTDILNLGTTNGSGTTIKADPLLTALGYFGGPTRTMLTAGTSPARDAAVGSTETIDQRGFPRPVDGDGNSIAVADLGAVECTGADGAYLRSLALSSGTVTPTLNTSPNNYSASVPYETSSITVTPIAVLTNATIKVNGSTIASGTASGSIPVSVGTNTITTVVVAPGALATNTYTVIVFRADNANLASLTLSAGTLTPSFASAAYSYSMDVPNATGSTTVTPTAVLTNSTIKVNGNAVASGTASGNIALSQGTNTITIAVTAPDGVTTKTYTVLVKRAYIVTTTADSGAGSLRDAFNVGANAITFNASLDGQTITLTTGALGSSDSSGVTVDASTLPNGIIINGHGTDRVLVNSGALTLRAITLTGGFCGAGSGGGAILNSGTLTLDRCTVADNTGGYGGAIWNDPGGTMTLRQCTIAGNTGTTQSGAIENRGAISLIHCTVAGNTSPTVGGIFNYLTSLALNNSIVAGNSGGAGSDMNNQGTITATGSNIVQTAIQNYATITGASTIANVDPLLSLLGDYGGPTPTMVLTSGSPAIDNAIGSTETIDQRGLVRPADGDGNATLVADIGATEVTTNDGSYMANLSLNAAPLNPSFNNAITNYTATVPFETNNLTVTPVAVISNATITVNGSAVVSGSASGNIPLIVGTNTITVALTAPGGTTTRLYSIVVTRVGATNASLADLSLGTVPLSPVFTNSTTNYSANVPNETNSVTVTPTAAQANATITVNGIAVASGAASAAIPLNVGLTTIPVVVTAQNGTNTMTYAVSVTRLPSSNAFLSSLSLNTGTVIPAINNSTTNYSAYLPLTTTNLIVTPIAAQSNATITVNGTTVASGSASGSISLSPGTNTITIVVTAQDGTTRTYTLIVWRTFIVTNTSDSGTGSLRQALSDAANSPGDDSIFFDQSLSGQKIILTSGPLTVSDTNGVIVDASTLPNGIIIDGNLTDRGIIVATGSLTLRTLTITRAYTPLGYGGGAILNYGSVALERCTLSGNIADYAAAIWTDTGATTTLRECTLSENSSSTQGGAIENRGTTSLDHCTVSANFSPVGGGINSAAGATLALTNTIIAGNSVSDINNEGTVVGAGSNIVSIAIGGAGTNLADSTIISASPILSALGSYGGPTQTMIPLSGSPAIDAATGSSETIDQRGILRPVDGDGDSIAIADIGAAELTATDAAYLANLSISSGTLSLISSNRYTATVANETTDVTVTPTAMLTNATIRVNGSVVASGNSSGNIPLSVGTNTIAIDVTAGSVTNTYFVAVNRLDNPNLTGLVLSAGTLSPSFASNTTSYAFSVANAISNLVITPTAALSNATIKINAVTVISGTASGNIALIQGTNTITIVVISPTGSLSKTYTLLVRRGYLVTTTADSGAGSLRQAFTTGADTVTFDPALSGQTIALSGTNITVNSSSSVTVDASALPGGITISGQGAVRTFANSGVLTLRALTLANGFIGSNGSGGAIVNSGTLTVDRCTLLGNTAGFAGGAIYSSGSLTLTRSTLTGNSASSSGGAIFVSSTVLIQHCTIVSNSAPAYGGIHFYFSSSSTLNNSIVAANTGASTTNGADVFNQGGFISLSGSNIIQSIATSGGFFFGTNTVSAVAPLLAPLGNYGGPTKSMPPLSGSPAIDVAVGSTEAIDQRGYPRPWDGDGNGTAVADIGAVEIIGTPLISVQPVGQTVTAGTNVQLSVTAFADITPLNYKWFFNGSAISGATSSSLNLPNLSRTNSGSYFVVVTNTAGSTSSSSVLLHLLISQKLQSLAKNGAGFWTLRFDDADGSLLTTNNLADFEVQWSTNLVTWSPLTNALTLTNGMLQFVDPSTNPAPTRFFRVLSK